MYCPNCGYSNAENINFCEQCGTQLQQQQTQQQQAQQQQAQQQMYQTYQVQYQQTNMQPVIPGNGMAIASMVLGIVSLVMCCIWYLSIPCAVVGLILGVVSSKKAKAFGMTSRFAKPGIICSAIALGLTVLFIILVFAGALGMIGMANDIAGMGDMYYY